MINMKEKFLPYGHHWIDQDDIEEVVRVLKSDWITTGPKIKEFEDATCKYIGCKYGIAVNSGTSALDIAVASLGLKKGEVITTPFTFIATLNAILYNNLTPIFVDIKKDTYNINPEEIKKRITKRTRAIIYVDYAGQPCDIDEIKEIAEEKNLYLIEDACHALGAEYKSKKIGNFADITVFSFHPVKLITTGEGGMCVTNNEELAERMRMLRNHGIDMDARKRFGSNASYVYDVKFLGRNYRMTDFQAAMGISQMKKLDVFVRKREEIARKYNEEFQDNELITMPFVSPNVRHAWHLYTILLDKTINRDKFFERMRSRNIGVNVHYIPVYRFSYYSNMFNITFGDYLLTENVYSRIVTLPMFPNMSEENLDFVIRGVKKTLKEVK